MSETASTCRCCDAPEPVPFLDLGELEVANALPTDGTTPQPRFPLVVAFCVVCALVQLVTGLPAEQVFGADYPYFSSFSDGLVQHARQLVEQLVAARSLGAGSLFVEIASNDGYLLQHAVALGVPVLGIEPTPGPAAAARERGVRTTEAFFGEALASEVVAKHGQADVVVANNVLAHVPDPIDFVRGLAVLVKPDGVITVENPGVGALLAESAWDTVYHEHVSYLSTLSVSALAGRCGLVVVDVEHFPQLHGGTLRWHLASTGEPSAAVHAQLAAEREQGLDRLETYVAFDADVRASQQALREFLGALKADGATIAAYGAAAKGATLLGASGIDVSCIDFVVDRNPHKQGRFLPGTGIPILPVEALLVRRPSHVLLLAWNVADEVVRQQQAYVDSGGTFLVPVPSPRVV